MNNTTRKQVMALVDCNNFFVSCERLFRPDLLKRPVVVLSSNDGCAVARSNEAKALGIPMGAPAFKYRGVFRRHNVVQFSANFELYADISRRIIELLTSITPRIEVYSVDESFLDLTQLPIDDYEAWGREVRKNILDWIGVPVSIGIAHSKTLAKLASDRAKKRPELNGALSLVNKDPKEKEPYLRDFPIEDIWGVGRRLAPRLKSEGVFTAHHLANMLPRHAEQRMGIHGRHMVAELNDTSCVPMTYEGRKPKSIMSTRTFGQDTDDLDSLEAALATFAATAAFKLRASDQLAKRMGVFITTSRHKPNYHRWSKEVVFDVPLADTGAIISTARSVLHKFHKKGTMYHRAGILLHDFIPATALQTDLLGAFNPELHESAQARMQAVDAVNERFGRKTITFATQKLGSTWKPKRNVRSPRYTTEWEELTLV